jgi:hypothetical protein
MKGFVIGIWLAGAAGCWGQGQTITVDVPANRAWTSTGVIVNPGTSVLLEASGTVEAVSSSDTRALFHRVPPEGRPERQSNKPQPLMPALVMLARFGNGPVMEAGARAEFPAGDPYGTGELQLGINDDNVADNSGSWRVRVTLRGASGVLPAQRGRVRQGDTGFRRQDSAEAASMIDQKMQQFGSNLLGAPTSDIRMAVDGIGRYREFKNGSVYWSPQTGAHEVHGGIRDKWLSLGGPAGELGYPVSDETTARDGVTRISRFQHGWISWNQRAGIQVQIETR